MSRSKKARGRNRRKGRLTTNSETSGANLPDISDAETRRKLAAALGRLGGLKGGKARAAKLTKEERSASASKAARARWAKKHS